MHVRVPPVALAPGDVKFVLTNAEVVLVQPFAELVTVTVYVPDELTVGLAVVPPETIPGPAQLKSVPVVVLADRMTAVVVQVSVPPVALAPGTVAFLFTDAVAVLAQVVAEFEMVTVYVPEELTVGLAVVPPETIPGPAQLKVVPDVVAAESRTEVVVHVSVPPVALAPGGVHSARANSLSVVNPVTV